ncbi:MAG: glycosyltransferase [Candidatus Promineifilaceae bacterium]
MNVLFLSSWYPYPPDNGSKLRVLNLLRGLAERYNIILISFSNRPNSDPPPELKALCREIHVVPRPPFNPTSARALSGLLSLTPRSIIDTNQPLMAQQIGRVLRENEIDLVIASQWRTAVYHTSFAHVPAIYEEVETGLFTSKVANAATPLQRLRHSLPLFKLRRYLRHLLPHFRAATVVSENEKTLLQNIAPAYRPVHVIPNGIRLSDYQDVQATPQPNTLIFSGSLTYSANLDAMRWFLADVYPLIQSRIPAVKLIITGKSDGYPLPEADNVERTGFVADVRPLIASAWISLAPLREGGGTRLKILEAMALGTPVVATSKGAEGIRAADGEHLLIADSPAQFATAVNRLLQDRELHQTLIHNSCQLIRQQYDWEMLMPDFLNLIEESSYG